MATQLNEDKTFPQNTFIKPSSSSFKGYVFLITPAKDVMFSVPFVCLSVARLVKEILSKLEIWWTVMEDRPGSTKI